MPENTSRSERKLLANQRLAARKRQVAQIRKWVAGVAVSIFIAVWVMLFVQLVAGHDPAIASSSTTTTQTQSTPSTSTTSSPTTSDSGSQTSSSSGSSSGTSPVTTSQS